MAKDAMPEARRMSAALSSGEIADEYRAATVALRRCEPVAHQFDIAAHPPAVIDAARIWWARMLRTEYESSSVFIDMALQLRQIDAPIDVQGAALRMAHEELRHAELCGAVMTALGVEPVIPAPPVLRLMVHPDCSLEETVARNVIYGCCLSETVNAARLAKRIAYTRDPFIRETFRQLAADERFHAQFGFFYLETQRKWLAAHPEAPQSITRYLCYAFASLEQQMGANPANARPPTDDERAIGLPDLTDLSPTFQETMLNACIPGLERFGIDAGAAWRTRTSADSLRPGRGDTPYPAARPQT